MTNKQVNFLEYCSQHEEIQMFESPTLIQLIEFKWNKIAFKFHLIGFAFHVVYLVSLFMFTDIIYNKGDLHDKYITYVMLAALVYPTLYEML